jgi:phosphomannomutase
MINRSVFKAYDIRGIYPKDVNEETIDAVVSALSHIWSDGEIVVACDGRHGSKELSERAAEQIECKGFKPIYVGLATTPMFYFLVNHLKAEGGMMITASHNPKEYNGVKAVKTEAEAISGKELLEMIDKHGI